MASSAYDLPLTRWQADYLLRQVANERAAFRRILPIAEHNAKFRTGAKNLPQGVGDPIILTAVFQFNSRYWKSPATVSRWFESNNIEGEILLACNREQCRAIALGCCLPAH